MKKEYYYIDTHVRSKKVTNWGVTDEATHTGETEDKNVHRTFLTKGQYNKFVKTLE